MQIETAAQSILTADASLTAVVSASKIRTDGEHYELEPPYVVHGMAQERAIATHDSPSGRLRLVDYEVNCVASTLDSAYDISEKVIAALSGAHANGTTWIFVNRRRSFEMDARVWVVTVQFTAAIQPN